MKYTTNVFVRPNKKNSCASGNPADPICYPKFADPKLFFRYCFYRFKINILPFPGYFSGDNYLFRTFHI